MSLSLQPQFLPYAATPLFPTSHLLIRRRSDFMASATTRSTLGSGSMLGIMNVLMQLRKVCNHPDLFEERSIRSPHQMGPLLMQTAAFVTRALLSDAGPMADVSFFVILFWIFWSLRGVCFSYAFKHVLLLVLTSELYAFISSMSTSTSSTSTWRRTARWTRTTPSAPRRSATAPRRFST